MTPGIRCFPAAIRIALLRPQLSSRVVHVHCKDARKDLLDKARATDESFMQAVLDGVFTVPGDGFIDYPTILKILHDAGYAGWLVCEAEQDPGKAHPLTYARLGFSNLVRMALRAGLHGRAASRPANRYPLSVVEAGEPVAACNLARRGAS